MPIHNLIEYSNNYPKTSGTLWLYCRDKWMNEWMNEWMNRYIFECNDIQCFILMNKYNKRFATMLKDDANSILTD